MKKILLLTLTIICLTAAETRHALSILRIDEPDITIGATVWYAWMDRYRDGFQVEKLGSTLLYGPAASMKVSDDFNLTFIFLYGVYDSLDRRDGNIALNYMLSDYFKVFTGVKYMGFTSAIEKHNALGPGMGLSATLPVIGDIFFLATLSGSYLWGSEKYDDPIIIYLWGSDKHDNSFIKEKESFNEYGVNGTLAFAYYIADFHTVISLGGRYQYFFTDYKSDSIDYRIVCYGVTLTVTYTFGL